MNYFLALLPLIVLFVLLSILRQSIIKSCLITLGVVILTAILNWSMPILNLATASLEGVLLGLFPIIITVVGAMFMYNLIVHMGSIETIKKMLTSISSDKRIQVLVVVWGFGSFLESMFGYGTAVAMPAVILISLGFTPIRAALICLVANTTSTAFGAVGIPVIVLGKLTDLNISQLSYVTSLQLGLLIILMPFVLVALAQESIKGIKGVFGITLASGLTFIIIQLLVAKNFGAELPSLLGSLGSIAVTVFLARLFYNKDKSKFDVSAKDAVIAWFPYILIMLLVFVTSPIVPAVNKFLAHYKSVLPIYTGPGAAPLEIKWFLMPGTLLILTTYITGIVRKVSPGKISSILIQTIMQLKKSIIALELILIISKIMQYSGMIGDIAQMFTGMGILFALISPLLGGIGTFVTGSDTGSNILFGGLQVKVAKTLGVSPFWFAAANVAGATAGKLISLQNIVIATTVTKLTGRENEIFNKTIKFFIAYVLILGLIVFLFRATV